MVFEVDIRKIKPNPENPRVIKNEQFYKLVKSIKDFPEMLEKRPLVCYTSDDHYVVLGGNQRLRACQYLKMKKVYITLCDNWTDKQRREFIIKDNLSFGDWNVADLLKNWDKDELVDFGFDLEQYVNEKEIPQELFKSNKETKPKLQITFEEMNVCLKYKEIIDTLLRNDNVKFALSVSSSL